MLPPICSTIALHGVPSPVPALSCAYRKNQLARNLEYPARIHPECPAHDPFTATQVDAPAAAWLQLPLCPRRENLAVFDSRLASTCIIRLASTLIIASQLVLQYV